MQVVHFPHAGQCGESGLDRLGLDAAWHGIECQIEALAKQAPRSGDDHRRHHEAGDGIDPRGSGEGDRCSREHHAERHGRVGGHVKKGAADVRIALALEKQEGGERVDDDAQRGHCDHDRPGDRRRRLQPMDRLPGDAATGDEQQHRVGECCVNRRAAEAPGVSSRRWPAGQPTGPPSEQQAKNIAGVVARVGQQRQ